MKYKLKILIKILGGDMVGAWEIAKMEGCKLPEPVATGFSQVFGGMIGASYIPALYCGKQIVNGTNYMIICEQTLVTNPLTKDVVKVVLHETLKAGSIVGDFSILSIKSII